MFLFVQLGFFNEADTLESSSILIYSELPTVLYTQWFGQDAALIKGRLKINGD
jgi:hypothetical protein